MIVFTVLFYLICLSNQFKVLFIEQQTTLASQFLTAEIGLINSKLIPQRQVELIFYNRTENSNINYIEIIEYAVKEKISYILGRFAGDAQQINILLKEKKILLLSISYLPDNVCTKNILWLGSSSNIASSSKKKFYF